MQAIFTIYDWALSQTRIDIIYLYDISEIISDLKKIIITYTVLSVI